MSIGASMFFGDEMRITMLKQWRALKIGQTYEIPNGVADLWILQGRAERMVAPLGVQVKQRARRSRKPETVKL